MSLFDRLKGALQKTKDVLRSDVRDLFKAGEILDEDKLEEFHRGLIHTDMGVVAAGAIVDELREKHGGRTVPPDEIWRIVKDKLKEILLYTTLGTYPSRSCSSGTSIGSSRRPITFDGSSMSRSAAQTLYLRIGPTP